MKQFVLILLVAALIIAAVLGGYFLLQNRALFQANNTAASATGSYQQIIAAQRGALSSSITVVGELAAVQSADLAFEKLSETTQLKTLKVVAGNTVKKGDVIATVDPTPYQQAVDQAKSDLQAAEETLADLTTPATVVEIAQADLAIAQAEYDIQEAKSNLDDLQNPDLGDLRTAVSDAKTALAEAQATLLSAQQNAQSTTNKTSIENQIYNENKLAETYNRLAAETHKDVNYEERLTLAYNEMMDAREDRMNAQLDLEVAVLNGEIGVRKAEQALAQAERALNEALAGGDPLELASDQLAVKSGEVALAVAKDARAELDAGADETDLASAQADVAEKKLALADAEAALAATTLSAPFDGTVLSTSVRVGGSVSTGTVIATIADMTRLEVLASVDETTVRSVSAGQQAQVTFDALPGQTLHGVVGDIPMQGELQGDVMVYEVPIALESAELTGTRVGMTANVSISTGEAADALLVPTMALSKSNGMYQVMVADPTNPEAEPQAVPVQIGLSDGTYTQITAGLNEGDRVVVEMSSASTTNGFQRNFSQGGVMRMFGGR